MDLRILLFASIMTIMIIPQDAFSIETAFNYSNSTSISNSPISDLTSSTVTSTVDTVSRGSQVQLTIRISDISILPTMPTGIASWKDNSLGGTFSSSSCALSSGSCSVSYTPPQNYGGKITITSSYGGDDSHTGSTGTTTVTSSIASDVSATITSSADAISQGSKVQLSITLADTSNVPTIPTGIILWKDNNLGGTFDPSSCTLSSGSCTVTYTPPQNYGGSITISSSYGGDSIHNDKSTAGEFTLLVNLLPTKTTISPNLAIIHQGSHIQFSASVTDLSIKPTIPTGIVSWSDGNSSGTFDPTSCNLALGICSVLYTPSNLPTNLVTVTAIYGGNGQYATSTGTNVLTINQVHNTTTSVTPNPVVVAQGSEVKLSATLADLSRSPTTVTGDVIWSDGNAGGTFDSSSCTLLSDSCSVFYTPPAYSTNAVTLTATYDGDNTHYGSSGQAISSVIVLPSSILLKTDQSYYAYEDVVTLSVNLPGQSLQSIAVGVSNPSGDNIISRTITTDENGTGLLQFKIPDTYQTGVYQDIVTAVVGGRNYTNSTEFNVIKSHGISIDSVQITNQQGNPVSILPKGQNGFVKVSISSGETMPALLTLNLFDANQSSLGTTSVKSIVNPGSSQMTLSFFIPSDIQVGLANVFTDIYSDWPSDGGTPLTSESCLEADLQDLSTLPVSYVPKQPQSCVNSLNGLSPRTGNTASTAMTSNQDEVTLGVLIQNDSMTFMSPAAAHLLALSYENNTAQNAQNNSVGIVNVNLKGLDAKGTGTGVSGNGTNVGPAQFTTLAGSELQNDPMANKILQEIEISKRQVANILGNQSAAKLDQQLILQQRQAATSQLKQSLNTLADASASTTPDVAYANFLTTVEDNRTIPVFQAEFNFMKQRVAVANTAMQSVLNNGGSLDQALASFNKYATINHVQMVTLNTELNIAYGLADSRIQSCFDINGRLPVVNGENPCIKNIEDNSTGPNGISILSVQATDHQGNPVSMMTRGQTGYIKVVLASSVNTKSLVTVNLFDSNVSSMGTASAQYVINPGQSEVVLPYYVPAQSGTGLASLYANVFTDWPNKGGTSQSNELSYFVGLS